MRSTKELRSARAAIFIGAILTVLAAAAIFFVMHMGDNKNLSERERQALAQTLYFPNPSENQQIGETESIVNNDPDHAVSIHYPVFGIQAIDLQVLEVVEDLQKGHREQLGQEQQTTATDVQSDLLVDYQSYMAGDRTASMVLTVKEQFSTWSNARDRTIAMVFDLLEGRQLGLGDIFQNDYLERLSEGVRKSFQASSGNLSATETEQFLAGTTPDMDNFQNFALTTDAVRIYFEQGQIFPEQDGAPMAEIPYEDLAGAFGSEPRAVARRAAPRWNSQN
ncbi:MAG: RsiV family protein [Anaeromassilibacillus sp.]